MQPREFRPNDMRSPEEYKRDLLLLSEECQKILGLIESPAISAAYKRWLKANAAWNAMKPSANVRSAAYTQYMLPATLDMQLAQDEYKNASKDLGKQIAAGISGLNLRYSIPELSDKLEAYWVTTKETPIDLGKLETADHLNNEHRLGFNLADYAIKLSKFIKDTEKFKTKS